MVFDMALLEQWKDIAYNQETNKGELQKFWQRYFLLEKGVYVVGFSYPVVPQGKARIRTQVSAGHTREDLDFAVECFKQVKADMGIWARQRTENLETGISVTLHADRGL